ncbi:MAG: hypothetical protein F2667_02830 [Actinobacteria bacterium]|uniref:Unannotated protein n=1 Tax=freshwater metagenome TaxID=449393 RepID=A0A6J6P492_9ZZZZ|nr:hypothetical protein [Actinomycetota bacterium]
MRTRYAAAALVLLGATALAGCGSDDAPSSDPTPASGSATTRPTTSTSTPAATPTRTPDPTSGTSQPVGSPDDPAAVEPVTDLLDWQPLPGAVIDTVTTNGEWTLTVDELATRARLDGPRPVTVPAGRMGQISDAFLDEERAVIVVQDRREQRPAVAHVIDLGSGDVWQVDARSDVPTTTGGTWAMGEDSLVHATLDASAYCLATVDLETRESTLGWCAPERHGFNSALISDEGTTLLTFDDSQPSCRTVADVDGATLTPYAGVESCKGWEGLALDDGAVWSVVPQERRIDSAHYYARSGESWLDLGPGTSGTLLWCDGAAYWSLDPQTTGDPARLMRWDGTQLAVVYESPGGQAFIPIARCGGEHLSLSALAEGGDEQVSAAL